MELLIREFIEMRARSKPASVSRRLAERCIELGFQELCANDEHFPAPSRSVAEDLARMLAGEWN